MMNLLSNKQIISYVESDARINVWEGSVRSGKTFASILKFIKECRDGPPGNAMIVGVSRDAIQRNIILEICSLLGMPAPTPKASIMNIFGRFVFIVGANDERAQKRIQGSTMALVYIDEITNIPEGFFKMLLSRLSVNNAKLFATCNPDSPFHWLKRDFIDNPQLDMKVFKFRLEDNPSLNEDYISNLKKEYSGLWYKRFIDGQWVLAEGVVYDFFDNDLHTIRLPPGPAEYYVVGIDYGTVNPTAFTLVGYNRQYFPNMWVEKEYYYSSKEYNRQKSDTEYVEDLKKFIANLPVRGIFIDPSAASLKIEMQHQNVQNIYDADNDVLNGIRFTSKLISNGTLKICQNCTNLMKEFQTYRWDEKAEQRGEDKPIKDSDHCFIAGTQVMANEGNKNIEDIKKGELVLTSKGFREVLETFINEEYVYEFNILGKNIVSTKNHLFLTHLGWKEIYNLTQSDMLFTQLEDLPWLKSQNFKELNTDVIPILNTLLTDLTSEHTKQIASKDLDISIEMFGNSTMEKFHKDTIFITQTEIPSTMTLAISNAYQLENINPFMKNILQKIKKLKEDNMQLPYESKQNCGMDRKREENGTSNTLKMYGNQSRENLPANNVKANTQQQREPIQSFVQINVSHLGEELLVLIMNLENAFFVKDNLKEISIQKVNSVQNHAEGKTIGKKKVYNLHVKDQNEFFAENILVHNCLDSLRYSIFTHFSKQFESYTASELENMYNSSREIQQELPRFFRDDNIHSNFNSSYMG